MTNFITKKQYTGGNAILLQELGIQEVATFRQIREAGGKVKKGSKGISLKRFGSVKKKTKEGKMKEQGYIKTFSVFKKEDCELPEKYA